MNRPINNSVLKVIKDTLEESKQITILNIFVEDNDVYGIYLNSLEHSLSFLQLPELSINTDIDGHNITFIELGFLLRSVYQNGALSLYNWLLHDSDIDCVHNYTYNNLIDVVRDNPPLYLVKSVIIKNFENIMSSNDKKKILQFIQQLKDFCLFDTFDIEINDNIEDVNDIIRIKNQLSNFKQELQSRKYDKVSEKKIHDIDDLYINLMLQNFKYDR